MPVNTLFHVAIKTPDLAATQRFYVDVLGMGIDPGRPPLPFPGVWLRSPMPGGGALFHIYAGHAALEPDGTVASGTGAIDHVSVTITGYRALRDRLQAHGLPWRENLLPTIGLWQIFAYDPSGMLLELTFSAEAEGGDAPSFPEERQYRAGEQFFDRSAYRQFHA